MATDMDDVTDNDIQMLVAHLKAPEKDVTDELVGEISVAELRKFAKILYNKGVSDSSDFIKFVVREDASSAQPSMHRATEIALLNCAESLLKLKVPGV